MESPDTSRRVRIRPEPDGAEREAIARALARDRGREAGARSAWWRAGVREALAWPAEVPGSGAPRGGGRS